MSREPSPLGVMAPGTARRQLSPGMAVGAAGALTGGVNRLPPVGLIDFSVGDTDGVVVDEGVVVVDVSGAFSPPPQAAVKPTIATIAVPPTAAAMRRARRFDFMCSPYYPRVANTWSSANRQAIPHAPR